MSSAFAPSPGTFKSEQEFTPVAIAAISERAGAKVDDDVIGCACG